MRPPDLTTARRSVAVYLGPERADRLLGTIVHAAAASLPQLRAAVATRDAAQLRGLMHRLRPSLEVLGFRDAAQACAHLEQACRNPAPTEATWHRSGALAQWLDQLGALAAPA